MIDPVIKWSGSKRSQALDLVSSFPEFETYYEPFVGGGSVLYAVIKKLNPPSVVASDICEPLIGLWQMIQQNPEELIKSYKINWEKLQTNGSSVFYEIRNRFNLEKRPEDLLFLTRTCVNGLIRFNKSGAFNNSFHLSRPGIKPGKLADIIMDWSVVVSDVKFVHSDYKEIVKHAKSFDFVYLDPPYFNTKGRYYGGLDYDEFVNELNGLNSKNIRYALSFDGYRGDHSYVKDVPQDLFKHHRLIESGNSPFKKVMDQQSQMVLESVYLNF